MSEEERFGPLAWAALFAMPAPEYPKDLPDDMVRALASLVLTIREAAENLDAGRRTGDLLTYFMPLSLITSQVRKLEQYAP